MSDKPLFLPLKSEHYEAFLAGKKNTEYRLHGPRWNSKTCFPERQIVLSRGYGKQNRANGAIHKVQIRKYSDLSASLRESLRQLYNLAGKDNPEIICVEIRQIIGIKGNKAVSSI
jgi:hypothetical protein